ncbi:hypothetical protein M405DRAFT_835106 [Rhizopogon salebrosus TDB-379]|nr:hypothetical protein M405DRAFT_835106 [Rhizopogon salebrosus TDB-379]
MEIEMKGEKRERKMEKREREMKMEMEMEREREKWEREWEREWESEKQERLGSESEIWGRMNVWEKMGLFIAVKSEWESESESESVKVKRKVERKARKAWRTQRTQAGTSQNATSTSVLDPPSDTRNTSEDIRLPPTNADSTSFLDPPSDTRNISEDIRLPPTNADSTSFLDADATQPPSDTLPEGFFSDTHPPLTPPARCSRAALVGRLSSLYCIVRDATLHNMPTPSIPLNLTRSRAILSRYQLRRNQPNIKLEHYPKKVEVSYTRGLARNVRVTRKAKNKHQVPVPLNIMTINVSAPSQSTNSNAAMQQSEAAQVQRSSSQLRPLMPAASTVASTAQQSGGAAHTQQPLQAENILTTTSATAAPAAPILTTSITGPPFRPDFVIRQPGLWTHIRLFLCRVSVEIADSNP